MVQTVDAEDWEEAIEKAKANPNGWEKHHSSDDKIYWTYHAAPVHTITSLDEEHGENTRGEIRLHCNTFHQPFNNDNHWTTSL